MRIIIFLFLLIISTFQIKSQVLPKDGSALNFRLVGFSFPTVHGADNYKIEVAAGTYNTAETFQKNIILVFNSSTNKIIGEVPSFGSSYTWRIIYYSDRNRIFSENSFYHFNIQTTSRVDSDKMRLRILRSASDQYKDMFVCLDGGSVICDMKGHPVAFIPDSNNNGGNVQDIKVTSDSTITFLKGLPYEIILIGEVVWKGPMRNRQPGDSGRIRYHHEFTKLDNGHYMGLTTQLFMCRQVSDAGSNLLVLDNNMANRDGAHIGKFAKIIEFDEKGNILWAWESSGYLTGSDFAYFNPVDTNTRFDAHDNSFFFDQRRNVIYISFKYLSRIVEIAYPSGKILNVYGENYKPGGVEKGRGLFCNQHCIRVSQAGLLYYFNNNACMNTDSLPTVVMLQEPLSDRDTLKKVWEYTCTVERDVSQKFISGGDVVELPDAALFVCMGDSYSKLYIVSKEKEILWSALPEVYIPYESKWGINKQDRANIISRHTMETLVWKAESN